MTLLDFARLAYVRGLVRTPADAARLAGFPVAAVLEIALRERWAARRPELADVVDLEAVSLCRPAQPEAPGK